MVGTRVCIAILDTGIAPVMDLTLPQNRILAAQDFVNNQNHPYDDNGHGTHVWSG
ncbi:MAG: S8 family serine peptidase [Clostridiales bacterium]|jgi:serine protease AprX|nr:S8 family serine peptidase [Clostridiales bacterium]